MIDIPVLREIEPIDRSLEPRVRAHLDDLTKPPGSLGKLEELAARYCLITRSAEPVVGKKRVLVFAADHGVADEGVSAYPSEVTPQMVLNMLAGGAAINVLAKHVIAETRVIDIGVNFSFESPSGLVERKIRTGTANMAKGPAMTVEEALAAIQVGIDMARDAAKDGVTLLGTGEMGIANTTPSSALLSVLLPCPVERVTGLGTGIDQARRAHKVKVIQRALEVNAPRLASPIDALAAVGGLEIAGICGAILGAASCRVPVVVDGFISSAGALVACRLNEHVKDYLFFSHRSAEAGHKAFYEVFSVEPILDLNLRLGEGTGAALAMGLIEGAVKIYNEMATFSSAGVSGKKE